VSIAASAGHTPIADNGRAEILRAPQAGAIDYIVKPFN